MNVESIIKSATLKVAQNYVSVVDLKDILSKVGKESFFIRYSKEPVMAANYSHTELSIEKGKPVLRFVYEVISGSSMDEKKHSLFYDGKKIWHENY